MSILDLSPQQLMAIRDWTVLDLSMGDAADNRVTVFERPVAGGIYVTGADFGHGISVGDFDAFSTFRCDVYPWRETCCCHGRWGETQSYKVLYALDRYYNDAFLVGERNPGGGGLAVMRTLFDVFGVTYMYFDRDEKKLTRPMGEILGHDTYKNDVTVTQLRLVVRDNPKNPRFIIRDKETLDELEKITWIPRGSRDREIALTGRNMSRDDTMKIEAPPGLHDDLMRSKALALKGCMVYGQFDDLKPKLPQGHSHAEIVNGQVVHGPSVYADNEGLLARQDKEKRELANATGEVGPVNVFRRRLEGR